MSIHRGVAAAAALTLTLMTAACTSDDKPDPKPSTSTPTSASPTPAQASEDPAADSIPLPGNDDVPIEWVLGKVNGSDPVVDVARRTISLLLLVSNSPSWSDDKKLGPALDALSTDDVKLGKQIRGQRITKTSPDAGDAVRILVQPPVGEGDRATAWLCIDYDPISSGSKSGVLVSVSLGVTDGLWKATEYNLNPKITSDVEPYFQRCRSPF